jgi:hypothetical protein
MTRDELEFSISQYLDGTLPGEDRAALEERFATDVEARRMLAEYRAVDGALKRDLPMPAVNWDRLAMHLSSVVADAEVDTGSAVTYRIGFSWRAIAIAATLFIAIGLAILLARPRGSVTAPTNPTISGIARVEGPAAEPSTQPAIAQVTVGPASAADDTRYQLADTIVYRPSQVSVVASAPEESRESDRNPYR